MQYKIPFNKPGFTGKELEYIKKAIKMNKLSGDGYYTHKCQKLLEKKFLIKKCFLTTSCTHALEMSAFLLDLKPGDEVITPSFTFVSTINAFVLRGAKPVFVDIDPLTLNIDHNKIEEKISKKTRAIFAVHYAGIGCEMDTILEISKKYGLYVVEDAAQAVSSKYKNKFLGTIGDLGTYSFHETKNYTCGEGGALLINNEEFITRAEIIREKGTDRSKFIRGEVDKYTWVDIGSSYLPSDMLAAYLYAQLENMEQIKRKRKNIFNYYYKNLKDLEKQEKLRLPYIPETCDSNYHMFYIILPNEDIRNSLMTKLKEKGIMASFHYIPLHLSKMGEKFEGKKNELPVTENISNRLLRLPFYNSLSEKETEYIVHWLRKMI